VAEPGQEAASPADRVFVPLRIMSRGRELRFLNMVATFGTALDVTAAELVIDAFYPADPAATQTLEESARDARACQLQPPHDADQNSVPNYLHSARLDRQPQYWAFALLCSHLW